MGNWQENDWKLIGQLTQNMYLHKNKRNPQKKQVDKNWFQKVIHWPPHMTKTCIIPHSQMHMHTHGHTHTHEHRHGHRHNKYVTKNGNKNVPIHRRHDWQRKSQRLYTTTLELSLERLQMTKLGLRSYLYGARVIAQWLRTVTSYNIRWSKALDGLNI